MLVLVTLKSNQCLLAKEEETKRESRGNSEKCCLVSVSRRRTISMLRDHSG